MLLIPWVVGLAAYEVEVTLDKKNFRLAFNWNTRGSYWSMSIYAFDKTPIVLGIKLVMGYPLLESFEDTALPTGEFILLSEGALVIDKPTFDNMGEGNGVVLVYITADELSTAGV